MRKLFFNDWITVVFFVLFFGMVGYGFYSLYLAKEYNYIVEAPCNASKEICFHRDCVVGGNCPPNNLQDYKRYYIRAKYFDMCTDNSCQNVCEKNSLSCTPISCNTDAGDTCTQKATP